MDEEWLRQKACRLGSQARAATVLRTLEGLSVRPCQQPGQPRLAPPRQPTLGRVPPTLVPHWGNSIWRPRPPRARTVGGCSRRDPCRRGPAGRVGIGQEDAILRPSPGGRPPPGSVARGRPRRGACGTALLFVPETTSPPWTPPPPRVSGWVWPPPPGGFRGHLVGATSEERLRNRRHLDPLLAHLRDHRR